LFTHVCLCH